MLTKKQNGVANGPRMSRALSGVLGGAIDRRTFLRRSGLTAGGAALASTLGGRGSAGAASTLRGTRVGVCIYSYHLRGRSDQSFFEPMNVLEYCHGIGAGGIQAALGTEGREYTDALRSRAEEYGIFVEGIARLRADDGDVEPFEAELATAQGTPSGGRI